MDGVTWELPAARSGDGDVCLTTTVRGIGRSTCGTPVDDVIQTWGAGRGSDSPAVAQGLVGPTVTRVRVEARAARGAAITREVDSVSLAHLDTPVRAFAVAFPLDYTEVVALEALDNQSNIAPARRAAGKSVA